MMAKKKANTRVQASKQAKTETIPNLYWRSITMDQLRQEQRCTALAPVDEQQQEMQGIQSHRYVRQDSRLWSELHDGMLTTGRLKAALGMHESSAGAVVGIHPGSRGSSHLLSAYSHLVNTTYSRRALASTSGNAAEATEQPIPSTTNSSSSSSKLQPPKPAKGTGDKQQQQPLPQQQQQQQQSLHKQFGGLLPRPVMLQVPSQQYHSSAQPTKQQPQQPQLPPQQQQQQQQQQQHWEQEAAAVARLERKRQQYNQQLAQQSPLGVSDAATGTMTWALEQQQVTASQEAARQHSERVAANGEMSVKMSWGKTQEASALCCVMQLFPDALLEEVGLFELDTVQLPASWNVQPQLLPPLGASPDAVLVHRLTLLPEDLQAAAALLARLNAASTNSNSSSSSSGRQTSPAASAAVGQTSNTAANSSSSSSRGISTEAAEGAAVQLLLQRGFDRLRCVGMRPSTTGVQYADSSDEDAVPSSSHSSSACDTEVDADAVQDGAGSDSSSNSSTAAAAGGSSDRSSRDGLGSSRSSSSDTLSEHSAGGVAGQELAGIKPSVSAAAAAVASSTGVAEPLSVEQAGSLGFEPVSLAVLRVLKQWQQQQQQGGQQQQQEVSLIVREAVEVKNHCPYSARYSRSGKKGHVKLAYKLSPRGCAGRVHPQWMPQLQLHMAATGCQSVLLASRCAATGVRVYRVWRDDAYLRDMMRLLTELQVSHVLRQIPPRPDSLSRLPGHKAFLNKTVALARGAECVAAVGQEVVAQVPVNAVNQTQFWQQQ